MVVMSKLNSVWDKLLAAGVAGVIFSILSFLIVSVAERYDLVLLRYFGFGCFFVFFALAAISYALLFLATCGRILRAICTWLRRV